MVALKIAAIGLFLAVAVYGAEPLHDVEDYGQGHHPRWIWNRSGNNCKKPGDRQNGELCGPDSRLKRASHVASHEKKCCIQTAIRKNHQLVCGRDDPSQHFTCQPAPKIGPAAGPRNVHFQPAGISAGKN